MRIVVTGAAGFIGSSLCEFLVKKGHQVLGVDNFLPDSYSSEIKARNWHSLSSLPNLELIKYDLREDLPGTMLAGADVIINEAAMPGLVKSWSDFKVYSSCNIDVVENLARHSIKNSVKHFIQISTSSVYGAVADGSEESAPKPISPYGVSKLAAEELIKTYSRSFDLNFTILRYFSVYGPKQRPDMAYHKLIKSILRAEEFILYGDGNQSRSNTYITDCLEATVATLEKKAFGEIINIAGSNSHTLSQAISYAEEAAGRAAIIRFLPRRVGDQIITRGDITKAKKLLGFEPKVDLREGILNQVLWQKNNFYP